MSNRYLLDTHILLWFLSDEDKLPKNIRSEIEYFQNQYFASVETLREIVQLKEKKKIDLELGFHEIMDKLRWFNISIVETLPAHIEALERLSKHHDDPTDRLLISQAISERLILVSADQKFPMYRDKGFELVAVKI